MATITLFANKINDLPELVRNARSSVDTFKEDLSSLITSALKVDGDVCSLEDTISSLRSSTDTQEDKSSVVGNIADDIERFSSEVVSVDDDVAEVITSSKDNFYDTYDYLTPECEQEEKSWWEKFKDGLKAVGEWCKEHWVEILIGVAFIVVGAILTALTGGAFLAALVAGLKFALVSALVSGAINVALYTGGTLISGGKLSFSDAMTAFGDGLASGFMWGGIFAGVSMGISAGFRFAASKGVTAGPSKNFKLGRRMYPDNYNPDGGGTIWNFAKTPKSPGFRFDVDIRTLTRSGGILPNYFHLHLPIVGNNSIKILGIIKGHIPIGLYGSIAGGVGGSSGDGYSSFKKWQREKWRQIFGN